ncbi:amidohydrolase [Dehalobacterium formicoaceticum]|uniref:amidohydrolase n=1 Tax=Dehalobacterium formicoaceticum TaxID=51515 RepID=UPI0031F70B91
MLAVANGKIMTMEGNTYQKGTLLIDQGKIVAIGDNILIPKGADVINAQGKVVMPGLIDAHTHMGIAEEVYQYEGDDTNEMTNPLTPHLRAIDGVNPLDLAFGDAISGGVTTVAVAPGSANVIGGQVAILKTYGHIVDQMVLKEPAGLKIAFGENPKRVYGEQKKTPSTRMATAGMLREMFSKAQNYAATPKERDLLLEPVVKVMNKEISLHAHAHRSDDILTAVRISQEFDMPVIIIHGTDSQNIGNELAERNIPVVSGPHLVNRAKVEMKDKSWKTPGLLAQAGVKVALTTDHPVVPIQYLSLCAALVCRAGMSEEDALKSITINAAEILGVDHRVGSLSVGKDADILIVSGSILAMESIVETVIIDGSVVYHDQGEPA